ncbi:hypothetical protein [Armatimonas rosea]|uniref:Uncharacterized protein n=1 Tax=Armatimonas rosea TaxID=685828 RepID=A0A7W9SUC2_ARMRO|nr:hypothetical protein [Armatimonas rosea]MBB6052555.1 hypothetical protein [Armatimonas rosea]
MGLTITHQSRAGFSLLVETSGRFSRPVEHEAAAAQDATAQIEDARVQEVGAEAGGRCGGDGGVASTEIVGLWGLRPFASLKF